MQPDAIQRAADVLWRCWTGATRIPQLPVDIRPTNRADGYAIQSAVVARFDQPIVGWKIAATSLAGQPHIGVDGPLVGSLMEIACSQSGARVSLDGNHMRVGEAEFAFRFARDLVPRETAVHDGGRARCGRVAAPGDRGSRLTLRRLRPRRRAAAHCRQRLRVLAGRRRRGDKVARSGPVGAPRPRTARRRSRSRGQRRQRARRSACGAGVDGERAVYLRRRRQGRRAGHDRHLHHAGGNRAGTAVQGGVRGARFGRSHLRLSSGPPSSRAPDYSTFNSSFPVVLRPSRSRCALAASAIG